MLNKELIERAKALRATMEESATALSDADAVQNKYLFPHWSGNPVLDLKVGDRVFFTDGSLWRVIKAHETNPSLTPTTQPDLFERVEVFDTSWRANANYSKGDRVTHNGKLYESQINGNVWEPGLSVTEGLWAEVIDA